MSAISNDKNSIFNKVTQIGSLSSADVKNLKAKPGKEVKQTFGRAITLMKSEFIGDGSLRTVKAAERFFKGKTKEERASFRAGIKTLKEISTHFDNAKEIHDVLRTVFNLAKKGPPTSKSSVSHHTPPTIAAVGRSEVSLPPTHYTRLADGGIIERGKLEKKLHVDPRQAAMVHAFTAESEERVDISNDGKTGITEDGEIVNVHQ